jgi:Domain of unknown function (DUF4410)
MTTCFDRPVDKYDGLSMAVRTRNSRSGADRRGFAQATHKTCETDVIAPVKALNSRVMMRLPKTIILAVAGCAISLLQGCASTEVTSQGVPEGGSLPKPQEVLVHDYAVSPDQVELDSGVGANIENLVAQMPRTDQERAIGQQVSEALANHLVAEIQALGLPAKRESGPAPATGNTLQLKGQFVSIDEGNQTARVVIGLGVGRTDVRTMTQAYEVIDGKSLLIDQFEINAESGRKPGMAETMGAGSAAGDLAASAVVSTGVAVGSEAFSANVDADAARTAAKIAAQLKIYFVNQGWIPAQ